MAKKIFMLSDSPFTNTGFSSQALGIMNGLADKGYECYFQAHNYVGQTLPKGSVTLSDGTPFKFTLFGCGREQYAKDMIVPRIREIKPDYFIVLLDTFMLFPWYLQQDFAPARTLWWFPSDGGNCLPLNCESILQKCSTPVAMAKFGQKQVKDVHGIDAEYIPHAVDEKMFYPVSKEEKEKIKEKWGLKGKFVVGMVGRNQGRKMHDRAIKTFAKWCKKHQEGILFMHLDPLDAAAAFDLQKLAKQYGILNRIRFSGTTFYNGFPYEQMNEIYNLFDIYLSTTSGEGFGVCTIEAMACGIPVLNTAYTTTDELVTNHEAGEPIKLVGTEYVNLFDLKSTDYDIQMANGTLTGSWTVERALSDIDDGAEKIEKLYNDAELRERYGKNGRKAVLEEYTWEIIINSWDELLQKL